MGLFGKSENLAKQLADAQARVTELEEQKRRAEEAPPVEEDDDTSSELEDRVSALEGRVAELETRVKALEDQKAENEEEIEGLKAKLANPPAAYGDAAPGRQKALGEGAPGDGESLWDQYRAIKEPAARTRFWREHKDDLEREQR